MNMHIRRATIEDLKAIQSLSEQLFEYEIRFSDQFDMAWSFLPAGEKFFTKRLKSRAYVILLGEIDGKVVGYASVWIGKVDERLYNPIAVIENLCVAPEQYRGMGVGSALMREVSIVAKEKGAKRLRVTAYSNNDLSLHFYRKHGYADVDVILEKDVL